MPLSHCSGPLGGPATWPSPQYAASLQPGAQVPYVPSLMPLSQSSPGSTMALPQAGIRAVQVALQNPGFPLLVPSSHTSLPTILPSPQCGVQVVTAWTNPDSVSL